MEVGVQTAGSEIPGLRSCETGVGLEPGLLSWISCVLLTPSECKAVLVSASETVDLLGRVLEFYVLVSMRHMHGWRKGKVIMCR